MTAHCYKIIDFRKMFVFLTYEIPICLSYYWHFVIKLKLLWTYSSPRWRKACYFVRCKAAQCVHFTCSYRNALPLENDMCVLNMGRNWLILLCHVLFFFFFWYCIFRKSSPLMKPSDSIPLSLSRSFKYRFVYLLRFGHCAHVPISGQTFSLAGCLFYWTVL